MHPARRSGPLTAGATAGRRIAAAHGLQIGGRTPQGTAPPRRYTAYGRPGPEAIRACERRLACMAASAPLTCARAMERRAVLGRLAHARHLGRRTPIRAPRPPPWLRAGRPAAAASTHFGPTPHQRTLLGRTNASGRTRTGKSAPHWHADPHVGGTHARTMSTAAGGEPRCCANHDAICFGQPRNQGWPGDGSAAQAGSESGTRASN